MSKKENNLKIDIIKFLDELDEYNITGRKPWLTEEEQFAEEEKKRKLFEQDLRDKKKK